LKEITATCTKHAELVVKTLEAGKVPLALGGDHSMAAGTVSGVAEFYRRQNQRVGLIWIDAHTDINTPDSSPSGNVHGMPLAALMGLWPSELGNIFDFSPKVKPQNCVLVGVRDIDAVEKENVRRAGIGVFTMRDIDERGMRTVMEEALRMAGRGTAGYHISLDMDWVDPEDAPGVGTPVRGGATYREAHLAMEIIADHGRMLSFEIVEVNPVIDEAQPHRRPGGRTGAVSFGFPICERRFCTQTIRGPDFGMRIVSPIAPSVSMAVPILRLTCKVTCVHTGRFS
jgi:arginase